LKKKNQTGQPHGQHRSSGVCSGPVFFQRKNRGWRQRVVALRRP